jgi:ubiquinone/menaquinone biosynthesis C-methylase UbiE
MFRTDSYVGIDFRDSVLRKGLAAFKGPEVAGIVADLTRLDAFPSGCARVVVSTHTLHHIADAQRVPVVEQLARLVAPGGSLICNVEIDETTPAVESALQRSFARMDRYYYRNIFSRAYEAMFERNGNMEYRAIAESRPMLYLAWGIGRLEYLTYRSRFGCRSAFYVCHEGRSATAEPLDLQRFARMDDRLYDAR